MFLIITLKFYLFLTKIITTIIIITFYQIFEHGKSNID